MFRKKKCSALTTDPTADTLAPILYNPTFSDTLLLVGSTEPLPSIEALNSPSFLLQTSPNQTVYPTLQPFTIPSVVPGISPIPAIINEAITLAQLYRRSNGAQPRLSGRRESDDSTASITPPRTPPLGGNSPLGTPDARIRLSSDSGREGSGQRSSFSDLARPELSKSSSETSLRSALTKSRIASIHLSRESMFGSLPRNSKIETKPWTGGSPIDSVINFIPSASEYQPQRAMQDMLHQAVVLTSGILPTLSLRPGKSAQPDLLPTSLLHVLPSQVPGPLPGVIENFLLGLVPKFAAQSDREIWSGVTTIPAWLASPRELDNEQYSGSEVLLLGGLRCPLSRNPDIKPRAFLPNWGVCRPSPGVIASSLSLPRRPAPVSQHTTPPSIEYDGDRARAPSVSDRNVSSHPSSDRVIMRGAHPFERYSAPGTPELDTNTSSSCSSGSGPMELSNQVEEVGVQEKKKKRGLSGWLKSKTKRG